MTQPGATPTEPRRIFVDVERNTDYMRTPGDFAVLIVGPFEFWMSTADGVRFGFGVNIRGHAYRWLVEEAHR